MEKIDTIIIGAGAIGLAIAYELSKGNPDVLVLEQEKGFGKHTSSRNSEVVHAGHYYQPGSLKTRLCVQGNELLYDYLEENSIPFKNTGKIIVANDAEEDKVLDNYLRLAEINGCKGFERINREEVHRMEPQVKCESGLFIPSSGIFNTHEYMQSLAKKIEENDAFIVYGNEVVSIQHETAGYIVTCSNGEQYQSQKLINSAGLWADKIAAMAGLDIDNLGIRQHLCKGQYFKSSKIGGIEHLIYPVADPKGIFLGIHLTINLAGEVRFGPNAFYVDEINYGFDESYLEEFHKAVNRYLDVSIDELVPDDTGIRPKLQGPNDGFRDFYIQDESQNGLPGFVNLIGMESPGLTASLAIAKYVKELL